MVGLDRNPGGYHKPKRGDKTMARTTPAPINHRASNPENSNTDQLVIRLAYKVPLGDVIWLEPLGGGS